MTGHKSAEIHCGYTHLELETLMGTPSNEQPEISDAQTDRRCWQ
jgi:hypothetical protein